MPTLSLPAAPLVAFTTSSTNPGRCHLRGRLRFLSLDRGKRGLRAGQHGTRITEHKRAEEALRALESDFAHMNRMSMMGELAVSLSHEIMQPIGSAQQRPCSLEFYGNAALACAVGDVDRVADAVGRIRDHINKEPPRKNHFDLSRAINEVIVLAALLYAARLQLGVASAQSGGTSIRVTTTRAPQSGSFFRFCGTLAWLPVLQTFLQIVDKPTACRAKARTFVANHMNRHGQPFTLTDLQLLEAPRLNVLPNHMPRHMTPTEASEKVVESG